MVSAVSSAAARQIANASKAVPSSVENLSFMFSSCRCGGFLAAERRTAPGPALAEKIIVRWTAPPAFAMMLPRENIWLTMSR
jgi:hypothetical protein